MKMRLGVLALLAITACAVMAAAAGAETLTMTSNATNSLCINPTAEGFKPNNPDKSRNYLPPAADIAGRALRRQRRGMLTANHHKRDFDPDPSPRLGKTAHHGNRMGEYQLERGRNRVV